MTIMLSLAFIAGALYGGFVVYVILVRHYEQ